MENDLKNSANDNSQSKIDCKNLENFVVEFLDDQLPEHTKHAFLTHIKECEQCNDYLLSYKKTIDISKAAITENCSTGKTEIPEELVEAILAVSKKNDTL